MIHWIKKLFGIKPKQEKKPVILVRDPFFWNPVDRISTPLKNTGWKDYAIKNKESKCDNDSDFIYVTDYVPHASDNSTQTDYGQPTDSGFSGGFGGGDYSGSGAGGSWDDNSSSWDSSSYDSGSSDSYSSND